MKKPYTFILNCGYVEHAAIGSFAFSTRESGVSFANAREALLDLAAFLKERFMEKQDVPSRKPCCTKTLEKLPDAAFCSRCRRPLSTPEFDGEAFAEFISNIGSADIDSYHGEFIDWNDEHRWQHEDIGLAFSSKATHVRFVYQAEMVLAAAVGAPPNDNRGIDTVFAERTEGDGKTFSYWGT